MTNIITQNQTINKLTFNTASFNLSFPVVDYKILSKSVQGPRGPQGVIGTTGDSAYDVAVDNGFVGTEQDWLNSLQAASLVTSVNTKVGVVVLDKTDIGLGNVDNTSDLNKPISSATQTALNNKQPLSSILTNTTASFTSEDKTKLDGIETGSQVNNVFISDTQPATSINKYMWIDTSGGNLTFWIEDGS